MTLRWMGGRKRGRLVLASLACGAIVPVLAFFVAAYGWDYPREKLEPSEASSLVVFDAQGNVLRQQSTSSGGRAQWTPLAAIAPALANATLASEDHRFYQHHGVDPYGLLRAAWLDLRAGHLAFGGSTITMQLVRLVEPRRGRGLFAKVAEAVKAVRLERALSKHDILEQYLNRAYYGSGAWGAEAAAQFFLGKSAAALSLGEAAFLAVLPRGPSAYAPYRHLEATLARRRAILGRMEERGYITREQRALAEVTPLTLRKDRPDFRAPHFVDYALRHFSDDERAGARVETTLDGPLQTRLEIAVREHLDRVGGRNIGQAGLLVLRNHDGAILALVGSRDYFDSEHHGAVNVLSLRRRPGSTLKPFVYGLAFERGATPATMTFDVVLPGEAQKPFSTDVRQHGFARAREALAGSYNLSAVHTLATVGVQPLLDRLRHAGHTTLTRPDGDYDLTLAIGEAEVTLIELAAAFASFGNQGQPLRPYAIARVSLPRQGDAPSVRIRPEQPSEPAAPVFSPEIAALVFDVLSDPDARRPMFGSTAPMSLPFKVALKTGTTRGFTDNIALGTTAEYTAVAWAGNFDGSPNQGVMAMQGAAPLVRAAFVALAALHGDPTSPPRPAALSEHPICPLSGMAPGPHCPHRKLDVFLPGTEPREPCTWHIPCHGRVVIAYPENVRPWTRAVGLDASGCPREEVTPGPLRITAPLDGTRFALENFRPLAYQQPPLRASPANLPVTWTIDGQPAESWRPSLGAHDIRATHGNESASVKIWFE